MSSALSVRQQDDPAVIPPNWQSITPLEVFDNLSRIRRAQLRVTVLQAQSNLIKPSRGRQYQPQHGVHLGASTRPSAAERPQFLDQPRRRRPQIVTSIRRGTSVLAGVASAIQTAVQALTKLKTSTDATAFTGFTCVVDSSSGQPAPGS